MILVSSCWDGKASVKKKFSNVSSNTVESITSDTCDRLRQTGMRKIGRMREWTKSDRLIETITHTHTHRERESLTVFGL